MAADSTAAENQGRSASTARCECPRCGYDVSGVISTWKESCPVCGRCSECGLEFEWSEMFGTGREPPRWLVEARGARFASTCVGTAARIWSPNNFWDTLRLFHEVRVRRLAAWMLAWLFVSYAGVVFVAAVHWTYWSNWLGRGQLRPSWWASSKQFAQMLLWPWDSFTYRQVMRIPGTTHWIILVLVQWGIVIAAFLPLSRTLKLAHVRWRHLARIWAYSFGGIATLIMVAYSLRAVFARGWILQPWFMHGSWSYTLGETVDRAGRSSWPLPLLATVWLFIFWRAAVARYLKLPHPAGVAAAVVIIGALSGFLAARLLCPASLHEEIHDFFFRHVDRWWGLFKIVYP